MPNDPRPRRTGTIFKYAPPKPGEAHGHYVVRCSAPDGTRPLFHLDPEPESDVAREAALVSAAELSEALWAKGLGAAPKAKRGTQASADGAETVREYCDRWFKDRERRGLSSIKTDRGRMRNHVLPLIGDRPVRAVAVDEMRAVVERLDETALAGSFSWSTALKVWGLVTKMFSDACNSKVAALRVRRTTRARESRGPTGAIRSRSSGFFRWSPRRFWGVSACPSAGADCMRSRPTSTCARASWRRSSGRTSTRSAAT